MLGALVRWVCSFWEVPDNLPNLRQYSAVVAMAMPQMKSGQPSQMIEVVIRYASECIRRHETMSLVISNGWPVKKPDITVAELEREVAVRFGVNPSLIALPPWSRNQLIRNTHAELVFARQKVASEYHYGDDIPKRILIVTNHLHMRRTLTTARKVFSGSDIKLYWRSVGGPGHYGPGYSQTRFVHPIVYLVYEILAVQYSKVVGWV